LPAIFLARKLINGEENQRGREGEREKEKREKEKKRIKKA
jgi:hypothetical protein